MGNKLRVFVFLRNIYILLLFLTGGLTRYRVLGSIKISKVFLSHILAGIIANENLNN